MVSVLSQAKRKEMMTRFRSKNTLPEVLVRKYLYSKGFRYRLHSKNLPGSPDIVLTKLKTIIEVNGCFWHGHTHCKLNRPPKSNISYWLPKIERNKVRDQLKKTQWEKMGWRVITVWECSLKKDSRDATLAHLEKILLDLEN